MIPSYTLDGIDQWTGRPPIRADKGGHRARGIVGAALLTWSVVPVAVFAAAHQMEPASPDSHARHHMHHPAPVDHTGHMGTSDPHAHHRALMQQTGYQKSAHSYTLPDYKLTDMDGTETTLAEVLHTDQPVMVNFIFTTCTTICPVMSATFAQIQRQLDTEADQLRMISISIDPDHDTPARLKEYATRFEAGDQWRFYTGEAADIVAVQKAFDVYRGSKMNHEPTTLLRKSGTDPWIRIDGLASASDIVTEYRRLVMR